MEVVSRAVAEHYNWGGACDGWHLLKTPGLSLIQERVRPRCGTTTNGPSNSFLSWWVGGPGVAGGEWVLGPQPGLAISPQVPHRLLNEGTGELWSLAISAPPSHGDRVVVESVD